MADKGKYLGVDPGRDKCGIAILEANCSPVLLDIVATENIDTYFDSLFNKYNIVLSIVGSGTYSTEIKNILEEKNYAPITLVDEKYTTIKAEDRYREDHPLKGYKRFLSKFAKWSPASNVDDYAALVIAEKYLKNIKK